MDPIKSKKKIKLNSLTPIKSELSPDEHKVNSKASPRKSIKQNETKTTKTSQLNTIATNRTSNLSFESISRPKNINEYKHILNNILIVQSDLDWTLGLRGYDKPTQFNTIESTTSFAPPTFYDEDFSKHKTKTHLPSEDPFLRTDNTFKLHHLVQDITAKGINKSQLNFETTLREFKLKRPSKTPTHKEKWKEVPSTLKSTRVSFLPPLTQKSKENLSKIDKYLLKEYVPKYIRTTYNNDKIFKKTLEQSKDVMKDYYGHASLKKYTENYGYKNISEIRHILANHTNTLSLFECNMRSYDEKDIKDWNKKGRNKQQQQGKDQQQSKTTAKPIMMK